MIPDQDEIAQIERELEILRSRQASLAHWYRVTMIFLAITFPMSGLDCRHYLRMEQRHPCNRLRAEQRHRRGRIHLRDDGDRRGPDMDHRPPVVSSARSAAAFRSTAAFAISSDWTWRISALRSELQKRCGDYPRHDCPAQTEAGGTERRGSPLSAVGFPPRQNLKNQAQMV
jgi:hypothetical protein